MGGNHENDFKLIFETKSDVKSSWEQIFSSHNVILDKLMSIVFLNRPSGHLLTIRTNISKSEYQ